MIGEGEGMTGEVVEELFALHALDRVLEARLLNMAISIIENVQGESLALAWRKADCLNELDELDRAYGIYEDCFERDYCGGADDIFVAAEGSGNQSRLAEIARSKMDGVLGADAYTILGYLADDPLVKTVHFKEAVRRGNVRARTSLAIGIWHEEDGLLGEAIEWAQSGWSRGDRKAMWTLSRLIATEDPRRAARGYVTVLRDGFIGALGELLQLWLYFGIDDIVANAWDDISANGWDDSETVELPAAGESVSFEDLHDGQLHDLAAALRDEKCPRTAAWVLGRLSGTEVASRWDRAECFYEVGMFREAYDLFAECWELDYCLDPRAIVVAATEPDMLTDLFRIAELKTESPINEMRARAFFVMGRVHFARDDDVQAHACYRKSIELGGVEAIDTLAWELVEDSADEARALFEESWGRGSVIGLAGLAYLIADDSPWHALLMSLEVIAAGRIEVVREMIPVLRRLGLESIAVGAERDMKARAIE